MLFALSALTVLAQNALPNLRPPYFAPPPTDPYFRSQWHLENRDEDGARIGADLNARGAWSRTQGAGVIVAVIDDGVEVTHPDLAANAVADLHYDFYFDMPSGLPHEENDYHGTAHAGLIAAPLNGRGVAGVAPQAKFASWVIYPTNFVSGRTVVAPDKMAKVFTNENERVAVQMHNWSETRMGYRFFAQTPDESAAISNAVTFGRGGKGVVMVRPAGNMEYNMEFEEWIGRNVNDDAFASDPRVITVAAARGDGRVTTYSSRGAPVLVASVSGDGLRGFPDIITTDLTGTRGRNFVTFPTEPELSDYMYRSLAFSGTSASGPMVAGVCALILSANPNLTYRDVQQVLIHSSRHFDKADPDLHRNGAGYWVSHRLGFGIPDAAEAVRVAEAWRNRPPLVRRTIASDLVAPAPIPDASLRVVVRAPSAVPPIERSFIGFPSLGPQPDDPTADLPVVDVRLANDPISQDLHGKAALIQRGGGTFATKLQNAAAAGAAFAIVYNNSTNPPLTQMGQTDFVPIVSTFIGQQDGESLKALITNQPSLRVQLTATPAVARFNVTEQLLCEHVGVRVRTTHPMRQDLRITLVSPMGTRSVLQAFNLDTRAGPVDWTYWSTHHFYELSSGLWTLEVVDEVEGNVGELVGAELIVQGTPIIDLDDDGLDDTWELTNFGGLLYGALDDPDGDGSWNAREQALGTIPRVNQTPFVLTAANLQTNAVRFAFPSVEGTNYLIRSTLNLNQPFLDIATIPGDFGETEIITDKSDPQRYFLIRAP